MGIAASSTRYPDFKEKDIQDPKEFAKKLSELTRAIDDKDKKQPHPYQIYGRTMTVDSTNLTYDGESGGIHVYTITIPVDVGTIFINYPEQYSSERVLVYLPNSTFIEGRTITVTTKNPSTTLPYLSISVAPGSGNTFVATPEKSYPVAGSLTLTTTVAAPTISASIPSTTTFFGPWGYINGSGSFVQIYIDPVGGAFTETPNANTRSLGVLISANGISSGSTITASAPSATTTGTGDLVAVVGPNEVGWTFQIRAYFDKWLMVSKS